MPFNLLRSLFGPPAQARPTGPDAEWIEAIDARDVETLMRLADKVGDIDRAGGKGHTALMVGARQSTDLVRKLLACGADVHVTDVYGLTALMHAEDKPDRIRLLLEGGAAPDDRDDEGRTALMIAALCRDAKSARLLIGAGADVNAASDQGTTALMAASSEGTLEIVRTLIDAGADLDARDKAGDSAAVLARKHGHANVARLLADKGAASPDGTVEVECLCVLPARFANRLGPASLREALEVCALFAGNQITPKYRIDAGHRSIDIITNNPALGAAVRFSWWVPPHLRAEVADATRAEWQELMAEIERHGISALIEAGRGRT